MAKELTKDQKEIVQRLREQHDEVKQAVVRGYLVVVKPPGAAALSRYQDKMPQVVAGTRRGRQNTTSWSSAQRTFVLDAMVWPEQPTERKELIDRFPGIVGPLADMIEELGAGDFEEVLGDSGDEGN